MPPPTPPVSSPSRALQHPQKTCRTSQSAGPQTPNTLRTPCHSQRDHPNTALALSIPCLGVTSQAPVETAKAHLRWPLPVLQPHWSAHSPPHFPLFSLLSLTPEPSHMLVPHLGDHLHLLNPRFLRKACPDYTLPHESQAFRARLFSPHSTYRNCHLYKYLGNGASPMGLGTPQGRDRVSPSPQSVPGPTQHRARPRAFINSEWGWQTEPQLLSSEFCQLKGNKKLCIHSFHKHGTRAVSALLWSQGDSNDQTRTPCPGGVYRGVGQEEGGQALTQVN